MFGKTDLVMTYASGHKFFKDECFWIYINSFKQNVSNADLVIFTNEISEDVRKKLFFHGVKEIIKVPDGESQSIFRDRHLAYWKYLNTVVDNYDLVLTSDSRDLIFQSNPFNHINAIDELVIMMAEGFLMRQSGFACIEHFEFERDVPRPYLKEDRNRSVVNGGTFLGSIRAMKDWHFLVWITAMKTIGRCTDQATVNWLMYYLDQDKKYHISFPQDENVCLTGEGVKMGSVEPIYKNGEFYNPKNELYCMVHQWDRFDPEIVDEIKKKYQS